MYIFAFFLVQYLLDSKLRMSDSLADLYGIPQLVMISQEVEAKKRLFEFVDRFILSFRSYNNRQFTFEEALNLACISSKISLGHNGKKWAGLVGCSLKKHAFKVCERLKDRLEMEEIQVEILDDFIYDAQTMSSLEKTESVVLDETAGFTLYDEV